jgi:hypothetical protein
LVEIKAPYLGALHLKRWIKYSEGLCPIFNVYILRRPTYGNSKLCFSNYPPKRYNPKEPKTNQVVDRWEIPFSNCYYKEVTSQHEY